MHNINEIRKQLQSCFIADVDRIGGIKLSATSDLSLSADGILSFNSSATPTFAKVYGTDAITDLTQLTTKAYVDTVASGFKPKAACNAATTTTLPNVSTRSAGTITFSSDPGTIDGVTLSNGYRILVKNETTYAAYNGIFVRNSATSWARATDMDAWDSEIPGALIAIIGGSTNINSTWVSNNTTGGTLNTTAISFVLYSNSSYIAGSGITITGNSIAISSSYTGQNTITTLGTIGTGTWNATTIGVSKGGTGLTALGTATYVLRSNATGTALEYHNPVNWDAAYNHSIDTTRAHPDYLINNGNDTTSGIITAAGFTTTGDVTTAKVKFGATGAYVNSYGATNYIQLVSGSNEMLIGSTTSSLYINYRSGSATTPTSYIWNAGSSSTYANHTIGNLVSNGTGSFTGTLSLTSTGIGLNVSKDAYFQYTAGSDGSAGGFGVFGNWRIDKGVTSTGRTTLFVDDVWIRGAMHIYELIVQQIRATNGSLWVSCVGKVASYAGGIITFDDPSGSGYHGFAVGDLIYMKRYKFGTGNSTITTREFLRRITAISGVTATVTTVAGFTDTGSSIDKGDEFVRIGSTAANRKGSIYLSSDDIGAPFMRIYDGVENWSGGSAGTNFGDIETLKAQIGLLTNITDIDFGTLVGYGLFSTNAYLKGSLQTTGFIKAGTLTSATNISTTNSGFYADNSGNVLIKGNVTAANYIKVTGAGSIDINSSNFSLNTSGNIGLGATQFDTGNGVWLSSTAYNNSLGVGRFRVGNAGASRMEWTDTNLELYNSSNQKIVSIGVSNTIAGWTITTTQLSKGTLILDASATPYIALGSTSYSVGNGVWLATASGTKFRVGNASASRMQWNDTDLQIYNVSNALIASFGGTNSISGWTLSTTQISKGGIVLDSSATPYIAVGATSYSVGDGVWLATAANTKFRVGNASASRMQWTDTNLEFYNSSNTKVVSIGDTNTISGFTFDSTKLYSTNVQIDNNGFKLLNPTTASTTKSIDFYSAPSTIYASVEYDTGNYGMGIYGKVTGANFGISFNGAASFVGLTDALVYTEGDLELTGKRVAITCSQGGTGWLKFINVPTSSSGLSAGMAYTQTVAQVIGSGADTRKVLMIV